MFKLFFGLIFIVFLAHQASSQETLSHLLDLKLLDFENPEVNFEGELELGNLETGENEEGWISEENSFENEWEIEGPYYPSEDYYENKACFNDPNCKQNVSYCESDDCCFEKICNESGICQLSAQC